MVKDKIKSEVVIAMKANQAPRVAALRYLISLIDKKELQLPLGGMTETVEVGVLQKELKNKEEAREMFNQAGRNDLVSEQDFEIAVVKEFLPQGLSEVEIGQMVDETIAKVGKDNFGLIMKEVMGKAAGRADGAIISKIVNEKRNSN